MERYKTIQQRARIFNLDNLIAWLETKDPTQRYDYWIPKSCVMGQYLTEQGFMPWDTDVSQLECEFSSVGVSKPWTFGAALERAKLLKERRKEKKNAS